MSTSPAPSIQPSTGLDQRTVWRWHFYAGLFCIPFVLWLAATGTVFLFSENIQSWIDRPLDHLTVIQAAPIDAQVQAALSVVPGATFDSYQLPACAACASQVLLDRGEHQLRVYIHPQSLAVLKVDDEDHRIQQFVFKMHGELLMGSRGSYIVELAAAWAVVMILTGLFLWWPRDTKGLAGVLYPRLRAGGRAFWKDIHSVTGIYVSFFALFLLFTGLPWAKAWGGYLKELRKLSAGHLTQQDWTTSSAEIVAARTARENGPSSATMPGMSSSEHAAMHGRHHGMTLRGPDALLPLDRIVPVVAALHLPDPVLVQPPARSGAKWTAKSDTRNRTQRVDLVMDAATGAVLSRTGFSSKPWLDRFIGTGIAAHEGALFGTLNKMISLFTTLSLSLLSISGVMMWWRRRPEGVLGAPAPIRRVRFSAALIVVMVALGLYFPFLGGSMLVVLVAERFVLRRIPSTQRWLGLRPLPV